MGRPIDTDKLKADLEKAISKNEDMDCLDFLRIASVIDKQPTAYDLDKVIEQLKKKIQTHKRIAEYEKKNGTITEEFQQRKAVEVLESAIKIIKAGQINENIPNKALDEKHTVTLDTEDMEL